MYKRQLKRRGFSEEELETSGLVKRSAKGNLYDIFRHRVMVPIIDVPVSYTHLEKADILRRIDDEKYTIQRSKGLGENDPEMMWLTTMSPASRRLIKVLPTDAERTSAVFDLLLGDNLQGRKEHIAEHGAEYLDDLDVS